MTDFFFRIGLSNACFSLALAIVAMIVGAKTKRPHLAHLLWLLVFVKLVTPPIVTIPVVTIPRQPQTAVAITEHSQQRSPLTNNPEFDVGEQGDGATAQMSERASERAADASPLARIGSVMLNQGRTWLPPIWLLGSVFVFAWSLLQVYRFSRLLGMETEAAPRELQAAAAKIARRLELNTMPTICTTSARLSPMVWWTGGKVRIVISTTLLDQMDPRQWQWILAHELAHVRRRDYLVRWLEWLACVCFWWNPVMWWARYNLRANEELCCDALVVSSLNPKPHTYADSLLQAVEILACPAHRPPATASEINSGGFLERRVKMIVSKTPSRVNSRRLQALVLLFAMVVLPLGIASAQDYEAVAKRLKKSVKKGEITQQHAEAMTLALNKTAAAKKHDAKAKKDTGYKASGEKLKAAVKAGKLTEEDAKANMIAIKKKVGPKTKVGAQGKKAKKEASKKGQDSDRVKTYLRKVRKELGAAVEAGKISTEDAAKRYEAAQKGIQKRMAAIKKKVSAKTKVGEQGKKRSRRSSTGEQT